jgi:hypothetical protein
LRSETWTPQYSYFSTSLQVFSDASILERLSHAENRILELEERQGRSSANVKSPVVHGWNDLDSCFPRVPGFHTGAACKILQYWPRLRVNLTIPGANPLVYLRVADSEDQRLVRPALKDRMLMETNPSSAIEFLDGFYNSFHELPILWVDLLMASTYFSRERILGALHNASRIQGDGRPIIDLALLPIEVLLILTMSVSSSVQPDSPGSSTNPTFDTYFTLALERMWTLYSEPEEYSVPLLLSFVQILLHLFARPFHAFGILRAVDSMIIRITNTEPSLA